MTQPLEDAALFRRIEDFLVRYVHCIDDDRLEEWPDFFTEHGHYKIISRENHDRGLPLGVMECDSRGMLKDRIESMRRANVYEPHRYRHQVSALQVARHLDGTLECRSNYLVVRTMADGTMSIFSTGRYLDRIQLEDGQPKILERLVVFDSRRIETLLVIPI
ncbi:MAG: aromatic-ring-hydroxylating dioxygenase subunit beta [Pseudomonadota bacterium]